MLLLIPLLPFAGFLVTASLGRRLTKAAAGAIACGAIIASFVVSVWAFALVRKSAIRYSFHANTSTNRKVATRPGTASGSTIDRKTR